MDVSNPAKELEWVCALDEEEVRRSYCSCRCDVVNFAREGVPSPPISRFHTEKLTQSGSPRPAENGMLNAA